MERQSYSTICKPELARVYGGFLHTSISRSTIKLAKLFREVCCHHSDNEDSNGQLQKMKLFYLALIHHQNLPMTLCKNCGKGIKRIKDPVND